MAMKRQAMTPLTLTPRGYTANGATYQTVVYNRKAGISLTVAKRKAPLCEFCAVSLPSHIVLGCDLGNLL